MNTMPYKLYKSIFANCWEFCVLHIICVVQIIYVQTYYILLARWDRVEELKVCRLKEVEAR